MDTSLDMDARIKAMVEKSRAADEQRPEGQKLNLTEREAKHIILRQGNHVSRSEVYLKLAKERKEAMDGMEETEREVMVKALGLDLQKAGDALICQRLGMDETETVHSFNDRNRKKTQGSPEWGEVKKRRLS